MKHYKKIINLGVFQHHYRIETYIQHFIYTIIFIFKNISINNNKKILLYIVSCNYFYLLFYH